MEWFDRSMIDQTGGFGATQPDSSAFSIWPGEQQMLEENEFMKKLRALGLGGEDGAPMDDMSLEDVQQMFNIAKTRF